jgi:hypothetical protein
MKTINLNKIFATFVCPECKKETEVCFSEIASYGIPMCIDCDETLSLKNEVGNIIEEET